MGNLILYYARVGLIMGGEIFSYKNFPQKLGKINIQEPSFFEVL
jgi:hypothetical protein